MQLQTRAYKKNFDFFIKKQEQTKNNKIIRCSRNLTFDQIAFVQQSLKTGALFHPWY